MTTIREATIADIPALVQLLNLLFSIEADFSFDEERQSRGLALMIESAQGCLLVAQDQGRIVGMCSGQLTISTAEGGVALLVEDVVILMPWRRMGLGRSLMAELERWAMQRGVTRLQLLADLTNQSALNFYKKIGWDNTQLICLRKRLDHCPPLKEIKQTNEFY